VARRKKRKNVFYIYDDNHAKDAYIIAEVRLKTEE